MRHTMTNYRTLLALLLTAMLIACGGEDTPDTGVDSDTGGTDTPAEDTANEDTNPEDTTIDTPEEDTTVEDTSGDDTGGEDSSGEDTGGEDTAVEVVNCERDTDCNDRNWCTNDACVEVDGVGSVCEWSLAVNSCFINNVCFAVDDVNPNNACQVCDLAAPTSWTPFAEGDACDDGNLCTENTTCQEGACLGNTVLCDDEDPCTADVCSPVLGCRFEAVSDALGVACDDGDVCTTGDVCIDGACAGAPRVCDDGDPCTDDVCTEGIGCETVNNTAACEDGSPCTINDVCAEGVCTSGEANPCDDFNQCTIDICEEGPGCVHLPTLNPCCVGATSVCDDGDPCTTDICDPETADCAYELNTAPCNDNNQCTLGDTCDEGTCVGEARTCDDGNACTVDSCNISVGCIGTPEDGIACDDGVSCTAAEVCDAGVCVAGDVSGCVCERDFDDDAAKVSAVALGASEAPGEALDVNGDLTRDNALGPLGTFINEPVQDAIAGGDLMLVTEFIDLDVDFTLALYNSGLDPADDGCDYQTATCDYFVDRAMIDADTCEPIVSLPATFDGTTIRGGGPSTVVPFQIPLDGGILDLTIYMVQVELTPVIESAAVSSFEGLLAGAVTEDDLRGAILSLPPDSLPFDQATILGLLDTLAPNDIDTDGDGVLDAKSIALKLTAIDARITGAE